MILTICQFLPTKQQQQRCLYGTAFLMPPLRSTLVASPYNINMFIEIVMFYVNLFTPFSTSKGCKSKSSRSSIYIHIHVTWALIHNTYACRESTYARILSTRSRWLIKMLWGNVYWFTRWRRAMENVHTEVPTYKKSCIYIYVRYTNKYEIQEGSMQIVR